MNLSAKELGGLGEMLFCTEAIRRGFIVSKPLIDTRKYDVVIDNRQGGLFRIQIKSTAKPDAMDGSYKFNISSGRDKKVKYTPDDIDFIVCVSADKGLFFVMPAEEIRGRLTIRMYPDKPSSATYNYLGAWDSFFLKRSNCSEQSSFSKGLIEDGQFS